MLLIRGQKNLLKSSFSLFEVILSITLLSIVISGFFNSSYYDRNNAELFMKLNKIENDFAIKNYTNMIKTTHNLRLVINDIENKNINVDKYIFEDKNIKLFKYAK